MNLKGVGYIVGAYEHPDAQALLHAECAKGARQDAGLTKMTATSCAGDALRPAVDGRLHEPEVPDDDVGGSLYQVAVGHALESIAAGPCRASTTTLAGRPQLGDPHRAARRQPRTARIEFP